LIAVISLFVVITLSILVTRIATIALVHTGLSRQIARFQARSAFSGAGFTTEESERVVGHPVRRRIVLLLMLLGNAGFVTAVSSLILTFVDTGDSTTLGWRLVSLIVGLACLWTIASSAWVDRKLSDLITRALERFTDLDVRDYASLMQLADGHRLVEKIVADGHWLTERTLADCQIWDEGVVVLGVRRSDGTYLGAPNGQTRIVAGDVLILYGKAEALKALDARAQTVRGYVQHKEAVLAHDAVQEREQDLDPVAQTA